MRANLGFLLCLPLLAGCGSRAEPIAVQYASYDDCLLDKLGRNQTNAAVEIITQACKSKYKKVPAGLFDDVLKQPARPPVAQTSAAPKASTLIAPALTRHHDGEVGGADLWADFDEQTKSEILNSETFHGYDCTDDCSGHEAGWEWAQRKGITDPDDCGGRSMSFRNGCIAYAEQEP